MWYFGYIINILCLYLSYPVQTWDPIADECNGDCVPIHHTDLVIDSKTDAYVLHEVMNSTSMEKNLIQLFTHRNLQERLELVRIYNAEYDEDLYKVLEEQLTGKFKNLMLGMLLPLTDFYAKEVHNCISGFNFQYGSLIEILGSLSTKGIRAVTRRYKQIYKISLRKALQSKGFDSGNFKDLCISLTLGKRDTNVDVNENLVMEDADDLRDAGQEEWDVALYKHLLIYRSFPHIVRVFEEYRKKSRANIEDMAEGFVNKSFKRAITSLIVMLKKRHRFFAERLKKDLDPERMWSQNHRILSRIIVGRSEIDLGSIIKHFEAQYKVDFITEVQKSDGVTRSFRKALVRFLKDGPKSTPPPAPELQLVPQPKSVLEKPKHPDGPLLLEKSAEQEKKDGLHKPIPISEDKPTSTVEQKGEAQQKENVAKEQEALSEKPSSSDHATEEKSEPALEQEKEAQPKEEVAQEKEVKLPSKDHATKEESMSIIGQEKKTQPKEEVVQGKEEKPSSLDLVLVEESAPAEPNPVEEVAHESPGKKRESEPLEEPVPKEPRKTRKLDKHPPPRKSRVQETPFFIIDIEHTTEPTHNYKTTGHIYSKSDTDSE